MFAFLLLLFILLVIYSLTESKKEGFNPMNTSPSHVINIPVNKIPSMLPSPPAAMASSGAMPLNTVSTLASNGSIFSDCPVEASTLPGLLPNAPYEQIAVASPLPYQDTTLIKANRQQLINLLELLKGFLAFEAQEISKRSDPTIQLPLQTARSDFHTLQSEVSVLNRNPGIQPNMTLSHLNDISSNLAFLQDKVRLIGAAGPIQGPIYEFVKPVEGFQDAMSVTSTPITTYAPAPGTLLQDLIPANSTDPSMVPTTSAHTAYAYSQQNQLNNNRENATAKDISDFIVRIHAESMRLSASGTSDPIMHARLVALANIKSEMEQLLNKIKNHSIKESDIPITKAELNHALPILGKPSEPLPQLIKATGLSPGLANLLPPNIQRDPQTTQEISKLMDKYMDTIVNGVSASFEVKYTSPREVMKGQRTKNTSTIDKTGFPSLCDLDNISNAKFTPMDVGNVTDRMAPTPIDAGRGPSHFDWKKRAKDIEEQVKKRGLKQSDFGIMLPQEKVSNDFPWKGYAYMMCTRLQATMDPSLPVTCGCPPMDWPGWRIAK
jgi:hypothetical protein